MIRFDTSEIRELTKIMAPVADFDRAHYDETNFKGHLSLEMACNFL